MTRKNNILEKVNHVISSNGFFDPVISLFNKDSHLERDELVALFKLLLIQRYYDLKDHEVLEVVSDRLSLSSFINFSPAGMAVTSETIGAFRERLIHNGVIYSLYGELDQALFRSGTIIKRGKQEELTEVRKDPPGFPGQPAKQQRTSPPDSNRSIFEVSGGNYPYPIQLRAGTSDLRAFEEVILSEVYNVDLNFTPSFIIDCGANIGLASLYFKWKYPNTKIVAIEPEPSNFKILDRNISYYYPDIEGLMTGVWNKRAWLSVSDEFNRGKWGFTVIELPELTDKVVRSVTVGELLKKYQRTEIDILKMDVEGAEKEIFEANYEDWLPHTKVILIETHDRFKKGCSAAVIRAISSYDFNISIRGNTLICVRP
jgi:FkbM family methyltransferase